MINELQSKLLEMFKWFHNYCCENNIVYYAVGGTVIGAARHAGFIPWDDDIDLGVPREDYNRLISMFRGEIDHYILESPYSGNKDYLFSYSKLYDTRTTLVEELKYECKRGIYIDVFPIDGIGNTMDEAVKNFGMFDSKNMFLMTRTCKTRPARKWYKNASIVLSQMIPDFLVDEKRISIELDKLANRINDKESIFVANLNGTYRKKEITLRSYFGEPTLYDFEDTKIFGPEKYDEYLTDLYGDWRKLPPEEKRKTAHDYVTLDLNKPYL